MAKGTKRASPGAEEEKDPLQAVELDEENAKKLNEVQRDAQRVELYLDLHSHKLLEPVYAKRREIVKGIDKFWPVALMNHPTFAIQVQHNSDQLALSYLEDLWLVRDPKEPRCYTIEFHFKENPHFTNKVLTKEYKYVDERGVSEIMLDFSWERDVEPSATKIDWKDPAKALTKLYPREMGEGDDEEPAEPGSFFNLFEIKDDPYDIGLSIATEIFPEAIEFFLGHGQDDGMDSDIDSDEDEDDDAEEIDLEKPRTKKQKV
ncbi:hypothetical protein BDZ89DRAFT_1102710 [Hymenopellis radicata]|nr:hypothetical protein BDZ89DRAFT_1102710 [Hymenopellis radicata]